MSVEAVLLVWFIVALLLALTGTLHYLPVPIPVLGGTITVLLLLILVVFPVWRHRALERGLGRLIAIHLTRFVGFYFLWLYSLGVLPRNFAVPAGWGDIIVATLAVLLLLLPDWTTAGRRLFLIVWNAIGLADILMVVSMAFRMSVADPGFQNAFASLPLSLLPTFIVPLVIASHTLIFYALYAGTGTPRTVDLA